MKEWKSDLVEGQWASTEKRSPDGFLKHLHPKLSHTFNYSEIQIIFGVLPTYFNFNIQISSRHLIGRKISNFEQRNGCERFGARWRNSLLASPPPSWPTPQSSGELGWPKWPTVAQKILAATIALNILKKRKHIFFRDTLYISWFKPGDRQPWVCRDSSRHRGGPSVHRPVSIIIHVHHPKKSIYQFYTQTKSKCGVDDGDMKYNMGSGKSVAWMVGRQTW